MSYARARMKSWGLHEREIQRQLALGGGLDVEIAEGGGWWLAVHEWIANQKNDKARLAELKPMLDAQKAQRAVWMAMARG
jgi:hypothetical protein